MYACLILAVRMQQVVHNMDANQWNWTADAGVDTEVVGPYDRYSLLLSLSITLYKVDLR
jgi:hypothetical protein